MMQDSEISEHWKLTTDDESVTDKEIPIKDGLIFGRELECDIYINSDLVSRKHAQLEVLESLVRIKDLDSANGVFVNGDKVTEAELSDGDILAIDEVKFTVLLPLPIDEAADDDKTRIRPAFDIDKTMLRAAVVEDASNNKTPPPIAELIEEDTAVTHVLPTEPEDEDALLSAEKIAADVQTDLDMDLGSVVPVDVSLEKEWDALDRELLQSGNNDVTELASSAGGNDAVLNTFTLDTPVASLIGKSKSFLNKHFDITASPTSIGRVYSNDIVLDEPSVSSRHAELRFEKGDWYIFDQDSYNGTYINKQQCNSHKLKHGDVIGFGRVELQFEMMSQSKSASNRFKNPVWIIAALVVLVIILAVVILL